MIRLLALAVLILSLLPVAAVAHPPLPDYRGKWVNEELQIGASTGEIAITTYFSGADLTIFGAITGGDQQLLAVGQYDVVVILEGPHENATVRKKQRMAGVWVNTTSMTFEAVPTSYSMSSSRPIDNLTTPLNIYDDSIGIDNIPLVLVDFVGVGSDFIEFRQAFHRLQKLGGLYEQKPSGVRFVSTNLFKAGLRLPANIPNGVHIVRAYLFKSGSLVAEKSLPLRVIKTGAEQMIADAAHERPLAYGAFAVFLALATGWTASVVFNR